MSMDSSQIATTDLATEIQDLLDAVGDETGLPDTVFRPHPLLIVLSGPSGVGKDTVLERLKARHIPFHFVVTATSRPRRAGEVHGRDYFFLTEEEFRRMIENDELLEYALVYDHYKGIPKQHIRDAFQSGKDVILRIDVQGAATIRRLVPEAVLIFLAAGDLRELMERLMARKTENPRDLARRMTTARGEMEKIDLFDYIVINHEDRLDDSVDQIVAIVRAEHARVHPRDSCL